MEDSDVGNPHWSTDASTSILVNIPTFERHGSDPLIVKGERLLELPELDVEEGGVPPDVVGERGALAPVPGTVGQELPALGKGGGGVRIWQLLDYTVQCTMYCVKCALYTVQFILLCA